MANNCAVDAKVTGRKQNVQELLDILSRTGEYKYYGLRAYECLYDKDALENASDDDVISIDIFLDVAWSIISALRTYGCEDHGLEVETKRLNLVFEAYSMEPGMCFQEHVLIAMGDVIVDECIEYREDYVEDYESIEEYNEEHGTNFTADMVNENGDVCIGGFGDDYGVYEDHMKYFEEV